MKILKIFGIIVIAAVAIFLIVGLLLPNKAHVERSITIEASPKAIFEEVNVVKNFNNWSPWVGIDPNTEYSYEGPESGLGAQMSWKSDHQDVGSGTQWIIESVENQKVTNQLQFSGFEGEFTATVSLEPQGEQTSVVWSYDADMGGNLIGKFFGLFMDGMLGPSYEKGLSNLKEVAEAKPRYGVEITEEEMTPQPYLGMSRYVKWEEMEEVSANIGSTYGEIIAYMEKNGLEMAGKPLASYSNFEEGVGFDLECGIPVAEGTSVKNRKFKLSQTYEGKVVKAVHLGSYAEVTATYEALSKYFEDQGYGTFNASLESYITDPEQEPDTAKWITHIFVAR